MFSCLSKLSLSSFVGKGQKSKNTVVCFVARDMHIFGSFFGKWATSGYQTQRNISKNASAYYDVLGLKPNATQNEIKGAYYKLSKIYHPDSTKSPQNYSKFLEVKEAYEVLGNVNKKRMYDKGIYSSNTFSAHSNNTVRDKETEHRTEASNRNLDSKRNRPLRSSEPLTYNDTAYRQHYEDLRVGRRKQYHGFNNDQRKLLILMYYGHILILLLFLFSLNDW